MIKLKSLITEGKITSDVDRAAKKLGIKFKKKVKTKITNDFTGPNEKPSKIKREKKNLAILRNKYKQQKEE